MIEKKNAYLKPQNLLSVSDALEKFHAPHKNYKVCILRPPIIVPKSNIIVPLALPLGAAYLAAILEKAGYEVSVIDAIGERVENTAELTKTKEVLFGMSFEEIILQLPKDLKVLGISVMFSDRWPKIRSLIKKIKRALPDLKIIIGGEHATALPEFTLRECSEVDFVITGEAELSFLELVSHLSKDLSFSFLQGVHFLKNQNKYIDGGLSARVSDFKNLPWPAWHLIPVNEYRKTTRCHGIHIGFSMPMLATRGCPYQCTFCSSPSAWTVRYSTRDVKDIADECEFLIKNYGIDGITLCDLTAFTKRSWILDFCNELNTRKIKLDWQLPSGTRSEALDFETLSALKSIGCSNITFAPESGSLRTLKRVKKEIDLEKITESMKIAVQLGYSTKANIVIGFPFEKRIDVWKSCLYALRLAFLGLSDCYPSVFSAYPGSELYKELTEKKILDDPKDDYFEALGTFTNFLYFKSDRIRNIPLWELNFYRVITALSFYFIFYLTHPLRFFNFIRGLWTGKVKPTSIFEQRMHEILNRKKINQPRVIQLQPA